MSTITVTNIKATGETASRSVSGVAAVTYGVNQSASTYLGISSNTLSSQSTNTSSYADGGTGILTVSLSNAMSNNSYSFVAGNLATNNTTTIHSSSSASALQLRSADADTSSLHDWVNFGAVFGDLS